MLQKHHLSPRFSLSNVPVPARPRKLPVPLTPKQWRDAKIAATRARKQQEEGFESAEIFKLSIEAKLREAGCCEKWFTNLVRCGKEVFFSFCPNCQDSKQLSYQCSNRICPRCNWRIANKRRRLLEKITNGMTGTKHVVVTQRNFSSELRPKIRECRANLLKLRRRKIFGKVTGGCASLEITNEKKGWHLHWHILVQASFVDEQLLAKTWGRLTGQPYAIVKVKPVAEGSYLQEICKYAAKASDLAKWTPAQIAEFASATKRTNMFTVFGQFKKIRKYAELVLKLERMEKGIGACECGCRTLIYGDTESACLRKLEEGRF